MIIENLYHCSQCKKPSSFLSSLFFVEDTKTRGFCCEGCIEQYFTPLVHYFETLENTMRSELKLHDEDCLRFLNENQYLEKHFQSPHEIWCLKNKLGEEIYSFISFYEDEQKTRFYVMTLNLVFEFRPSFVLLATATMDQHYLSKFRIGQKIEDISQFNNATLTSTSTSTSAKQDDPYRQAEQEIIDMLEAKKSALLAQILQNRSESDISFNDFSSYDHCFQETINNPDEIYNFQDNEGDNLFSYMKAYQQNNTSFYYIVICLEIPNMRNSNEGDEDSGLIAEIDNKHVLPIVAFPTKDGKLSQFYQQGKQIVGNLKN